jgi:hypothetical protein
MKQCKICNQSKELTEFAKNNQQKDGFHIYCKPCTSEKYSNKWYQANKEKHNENEKSRRKQNPEMFKERSAEYYRKNKKSILEKQLKYLNEKYKIDPLYAMKKSLAATIRSAIKYKGLEYTEQKPRTHELLGCSYAELKIYLESKFENWMSWDNRGKYNGQPNVGWDIDHIIPLASATSTEELEKLCHFSNLQPLCSYQNRNIKRNKLI